MTGIMPLAAIALLIYSLPLLVIHLVPMADAWRSLRPGVWWRTQRASLDVYMTIDLVVAKGAEWSAARSLMLSHLNGERR